MNPSPFDQRPGQNDQTTSGSRQCPVARRRGPCARRRLARLPELRLLPLVGLAALATFLAGGCAAEREIRPGFTFPRTVAAGETLDVQVFRHETQIEFTNTTARAFGPSTIWLNRRFSRQIEGLEVGQTMRFPLREFRDRFGDSFRAGGFFALERPERLAVAELETEQDGEPVVLGLIVVGSGM